MSLDIASHELEARALSAGEAVGEWDPDSDSIWAEAFITVAGTTITLVLVSSVAVLMYLA